MTKKNGNSKYAGYLKSMDIGDSFFVKDATLDDLRFLYAVARRAGMKVLIRSVDYDEVYFCKGVRVWREQ